jgi:dihydroorotase
LSGILGSSICYVDGLNIQSSQTKAFKFLMNRSLKSKHEHLHELSNALKKSIIKWGKMYPSCATMNAVSVRKTNAIKNGNT